MRITGIQQLAPVGRSTIAELHRGSSASGEQVEVFVVDAAAWAAPGVAERVRRAAAVQALEVRRPLALESMPDGRLAIVTETRRSVGQLLKEGVALTPNDAATITQGVAKALQAVHDAGLTHGRVDPASVRVGGGPPAWLPELAGLTEAQVPGEPPTPWAAPEVLAGQPATPASDVYSLGRLLLALLHRDVNVAPTAPPPASAAYFATVLAGCLATDPARRFPTAQHVVKALGLVSATFVGPARVPSQDQLPAVQAPVTASQGAEAQVEAVEYTPTQLGPWVVEALLGEGAMGQVYRARHAKLGRKAAIKLLRPELYRSPDLVQRFFQEATTVNRVNHEHIVQITDFVQEDGPLGPKAVYCVMELLEGESLATRISRQPLPIKRAVHIAEQVCGALGAAHAVGVIHRDVKAENVLLCTRAGDPDYVKVLDFGVAKLLGGEGKGPMVSTMDGAIIGTPAAMAPEQAAGGDVDHRIDVYAVGVLLYEMLSGRLPFDDSNFAALVVKLMSAPPPPLPAKTPAGEPIPPALAALVMRCLSKAPEERPQTMQALSDALAQAVASAASGVAAPAEADAARAVAPTRRGLIAGLVALIAALGGGVWWVFRQEPPKPVVVPVERPTPREPLAAAPLDAGEPVPEPAEADAGAVAAPVDAPPDAGAPRPGPRPSGVTYDLSSQPSIDRVSIDSGFADCISRFQAALPKDAERIVLRISVTETGRVSNVEVAQPELKSARLKQCLVTAGRQLKFRSPKRQAKLLTVPLLLTAEPE